MGKGKGKPPVYFLRGKKRPVDGKGVYDCTHCNVGFKGKSERDEHQNKCRMKEAFSLDAQQNNPFKHQQVQNFTNQNWLIILKVAAFKNNRTKRSGFAYQALNQEGAIIFSGGSSCGKKHYLALQEAVSEGVLKAKELGFNRVLILSTSKGFDQFCNRTRKPDWMEKTLYSDLQQLKFQGLLVNHLLVPRIVISHVLKLAYITTAFPVHHCRLNPDYVLAS